MVLWRGKSFPMLTNNDLKKKRRKVCFLYFNYNIKSKVGKCIKAKEPTKFYRNNLSHLINYQLFNYFIKHYKEIISEFFFNVLQLCCSISVDYYIVILAFYKNCQSLI